VEKEYDFSSAEGVLIMRPLYAFILLISSHATAQEPHRSSQVSKGGDGEGYFPIIGVQPRVYDLKASAEAAEFEAIYGKRALIGKGGKGEPVAATAKNKIVAYVSKAAMQKFVRDLRNDICGALQPGDSLKVAVAFDAGGQVGFAEFNGSGSIEVQINCSREQR
jgi:hypothetical protein